VTKGESMRIETGAELRDAGMKRVIEHNADWAFLASTMLDQELNCLPVGTLFTGEDLHLILADRGLEEPMHVNAWAAAIGAKVRRWLRTGDIEQAGATTANRPAAHGRLIRRYRKRGPGSD